MRNRNLNKGQQRAFLSVEALESRDVPTVFITPTVIPLQSLLHPAPTPPHHHGHAPHSNAGGVITIHVVGDTTTGQSLVQNASKLTETVSLNGGTPVSITPQAVNSGNGEVVLQISRSQLKNALPDLSTLKTSEPITVTVTGPGSTSGSTVSESGSLFILVPHHFNGSSSGPGNSGGNHGHENDQGDSGGIHGHHSSMSGNTSGS